MFTTISIILIFFATLFWLSFLIIHNISSQRYISRLQRENIKLRTNSLSDSLEKLKLTIERHELIEMIEYLSKNGIDQGNTIEHSLGITENTDHKHALKIANDHIKALHPDHSGSENTSHLMHQIIEYKKSLKSA